MKIEQFEYELPKDLIAESPLDERDSSKLMVVHRIPNKYQDECHRNAHNPDHPNITHAKFNELTNFLNKGDLLVVNDSQVIPAKIRARRQSGGLIDFLLIKQDTKRPGYGRRWRHQLSG